MDIVMDAVNNLFLSTDLLVSLSLHDGLIERLMTTSVGTVQCTS